MTKKRIYKVCVTIRLEEDVIEEIDLLAAEETRTRSQYIENVLRDHIHKISESRDYDYKVAASIGGE